MIISDRSFYVIEGFEPATYVDMGRYYFSVGIEKSLAKKALEYKIEDEVVEKLRKIGQEIMAGTGLLKKDDKFASPYGYRFHENENKTTLLISNVSVPGDACELSLDWSEFRELNKENSCEKFFGYYPHNIDNTVQAYTLLSLWLRWAEHVKAICGEQPK